ncbi:MAG: hypothetical protein ACRDJ4_14495 [Actinomycetota bacterium]
MAYEQFGHQYSAMENVGRTLALLVAHAAGCDYAPTPAEWAQALGVPLEQFMQIGFAMHIAAVKNQGRITRELLQAEHVAPIFRPLTAGEALGVIDRWYAGPLKNLRAEAIAEEVRGREKWPFNPLVAHPVVAIDDRYVVPWPRLVLDRFTPTGLYFIGLESFGSRFPDALGCMFENYVGTQLGLIPHAEIRPEIRFGKPEQRTVDYFFVLPQVVVLVEVKSARPTAATRLGEPVGDEDVGKKIGKALGQIDRTARMLNEGHPALVAIPCDRPVCGLVITLEPFHLLNTPFDRELLPTARVPCAVASAHEFEGFVAASRAVPDPGSRLLSALSPCPPTPPSLLDAVRGTEAGPNPLLDDAWERFTAPWSGTIS